MLGHDFNKTWTFAIRITKTLQSHKINVQHAIQKISICAFSLEREGRFISIVNLFHSFKSLPIQEEVLRGLYYSMDKSQEQNRFDWRLLLFMLHCISNCNMEPRQIMRDAFLYYQGCVMDLEYTTRCDFELTDIYTVLQFIIRPEMINAFDKDFWSHFNVRINGSIDYTLQVISKSIKLSLSVILLIFNDMKTLDSSDFEENFFPLPLVHHLTSRRIMTVAIETIMHRRRRFAFKLWDEIVQYRRRVHNKLDGVLILLQRRCYNVGFQALLNVTIQCHASILIQRCFRKHKHRTSLFSVFMFNRCAIAIQSEFRRYRDRKHFLRYLNQRRLSAIEIQRIFRGYLGRNIRRARKRVYLQEIEMHEKNNFEIQLRLKMISSSITLQRLVRTYQDRKRFEIEGQRKIRVQQISAEIEDEVNQHSLEIKIHETQVKNHIEQMQVDKRNEDIVGKRINCHMEDIKRLRRRLTASEAESRRQSYQRLKVQKLLKRQEICRHKWSQMIAERSADYKIFCRSCIIKPEMKDEKKFGRTLKRLVYERIKDVLNRANDRDLKMEVQEAKEIAQEEIIEIMVSREVDKMNQSMNAELEELSQAYEKEIQEALDNERRMAIARASQVVVSSIQKWRARRSLNLLCMMSYEKLFDETYLAFYYRNIRTSEVTWKKPKALGKLDIEVREEWKKWL